MPIVRSPRRRRSDPPAPPRAPPRKVWGRLREVLTGALRWLNSRALHDAIGDHLDEPAKAAAAAIDLVPWEEVTGPIIDALTVVLAPAFRAAAQAVEAEARDRAPTVRPSPFRPVDAESWARQHAANRVVQINADTRNAIRDRIVTGLEEGRSVDEVTADVRQVVGLHSRWATAVTNRARVLAEDPNVSRAQRKVLIDAYRNKLLDARARNIAHSELLTASAAGRMAGYVADAASGGLTMAEVEKVWLTASTDVCALCEPLHNVAVPGLEGGWDIGGGLTILHPPRHPSCRCSFYVRPVARR